MPPLILAGHQPRLMLRSNQVIGNQLLHPLILRPPSETFAVQDTLAHQRGLELIIGADVVVTDVGSHGLNSLLRS